MDYQYLTTLFIKGELKTAVDYMRGFEELKDQVAAYDDIFEKEQYIHYDIPKVLDDILLDYQRYYRDAFYLGMEEEEASAALLERLAEKLDVQSVVDELSEALKVLFEENGYHILTGMTEGYRGPYVWKETVPTEYEVELPCSVSSYKVNILRGFVMRSWMDYLTFGQKGTRGWAGEDGVINCIEDAWDFESEDFRVSLLKHEAQHVQDMAKWPDMTSAQLEFRAKLVELIYSENPALLAKFISQADASKKNDGHAIANARIAEGFKGLEDGPVSEIQKRAHDLFDLDNERRI